MGTRTVLRITCIVICLVVISGCYGRRIYDVETRVDYQNRVIRRLEDSLAYVTGEIAHLDSTVGRSSAPVRTDRALTESRLDEIQTRLEILESLVKENRYRISQISMRRGRAASPDTTPEFADTSIVQASVATHLYETAYVDFVKGNFQAAINGFRDFVKRFPMTDFSDDAQYMIAQSYFVLGEFPEAIIEFRKVLDDYPSGDRVPEAMYKLGLCYVETDDIETGREYFKLLLSRYPTAVETRQAREMLEVLPPPPEGEED